MIKLCYDSVEGEQKVQKYFDGSKNVLSISTDFEFIGPKESLLKRSSVRALSITSNYFPSADKL